MRSKFVTWVLSVAFLVLSAGIAAAQTDSPSDRTSHSTERLCAFPDQTKVIASETTDAVAPDGQEVGPPGYTAWFTDAEGSASNERLNEAMVEFESTLVGIVPELNSRSMFVVVDPSADLERVRAVVQEVRASFPVKVVYSCNELAVLRDTLAKLETQPSAKGATFAAYIEARTGRVHVVLSEDSERSAAAGEEFAKQFGDLVQISLGEVARAGRYDDGNPHYGAAAIGPVNSSYTCSANATVIGIYGIRFMPTAGHCLYGNGANWYSDGVHGYGYEVYRSPDWPAHDIGLLQAFSDFGEYFTNKIHTEPGTPLVRTITGGANPSLNQSVCLSGARTHAHCNLIVNGTGNISFCDASGCTYYSYQAYVPMSGAGDLTPCYSGDSGGIMYTRPTSTTATGRGLFYGFADVPIYGVRNCYFHPTSELPGTYLTSP